MKRKRSIRRFFSGLTAATLAATAVTVLPIMAPMLQQVLGRAAAASAMLQMPEGGFAYLRDRFSEELAQDEPHTDPPFPEISASAESVLPHQAPKKDPPTPEQPEPDPDAVPLPSDDIPSPSPDTIPAEHLGTITEQTFGADESPLYIPLEAGYIKNSTDLSNQEVLTLLSQPLEIRLQDTDEPQVLILHTHATESFEPFDRDFCDLSYSWRSTDNDQNVVFLGRVMAQELEAAGIGVVHDETQHDYPSYNGSYERSAATIRKWLDRYPSIQVVIDLHRDAIENPIGNLIKPVADIEGEKTAQVMIIAGCDDGAMDMPNWDKNLRWAAALQSTAEKMYPGLTRPVFFCYRKYNMDLTGGSLLIEFGSHGNTLAQTARAARYMGRAMAETLLATRQDPSPQEEP